MMMTLTLSTSSGGNMHNNNNKRYTTTTNCCSRLQQQQQQQQHGARLQHKRRPHLQLALLLALALVMLLLPDVCKCEDILINSSTNPSMNQYESSSDNQVIAVPEQTYDSDELKSEEPIRDDVKEALVQEKEHGDEEKAVNNALKENLNDHTDESQSHNINPIKLQTNTLVLSESSVLEVEQHTVQSIEEESLVNVNRLDEEEHHVEEDTKLSKLESESPIDNDEHNKQEEQQISVQPQILSTTDKEVTTQTILKSESVITETSVDTGDNNINTTTSTLEPLSLESSAVEMNANGEISITSSTPVNSITSEAQVTESTTTQSADKNIDEISLLHIDGERDTQESHTTEKSAEAQAVVFSEEIPQQDDDVNVNEESIKNEKPIEVQPMLLNEPPQSDTDGNLVEESNLVDSHSNNDVAKNDKVIVDTDDQNKETFTNQPVTAQNVVHGEASIEVFSTSVAPPQYESDVNAQPSALQSSSSAADAESQTTQIPVDSNYISFNENLTPTEPDAEEELKQVDDELKQINDEDQRENSELMEEANLNETESITEHNVTKKQGVTMNEIPTLEDIDKEVDNMPEHKDIDDAANVSDSSNVEEKLTSPNDDKELDSAANGGTPLNDEDDGSPNDNELVKDQLIATTISIIDDVVINTSTIKNNDNVESDISGDVSDMSNDTGEDTNEDTKDEQTSMPIDDSATETTTTYTTDIAGISTKGSRSVDISSSPTLATLLEQQAGNVGHIFNDNLAVESTNSQIVGSKTLPSQQQSLSHKMTKRSLAIILACSCMAVMFVVISVTMFLISFQRQRGTLDIEKQERFCGKDTHYDDCVMVGEEGARLQLLEIELPAVTQPQAASSTDAMINEAADNETDDCL